MSATASQPPAASAHRLGFQTLTQELPPVSLPVQGTFPSWLAGALLRTGPAMFEAADRGYQHWFDGLAMLHRFGFADGAVSYANRFLDTPAYRAVRDTGQIAYSEFATDPCRSLFKRVTSVFAPPEFGQNANVNIVRQGDEFLALTESPLPVVFDPETLATAGVARPAPGQFTVAHPHRAPGSGDLVSYATHFGPRSVYRVYRQDKHGERHILVELPVDLPSYMHSFAITDRYLVLAEFPFVVFPAAIPLSGRPFIRNYRWRPGRATRFRILDLGTGSVVATCAGEPFFAFHHVNAYQRGPEIVLDVCAYDTPDIIDALYLDRLRTAGSRVPSATLRRYRLPLTGGDAIAEPLSDAPLDPVFAHGVRCGLGGDGLVAGSFAALSAYVE
jgi:carotenoid cleavage dioxygenase-like enzyme